jgi:hypothetical protein
MGEAYPDELGLCDDDELADRLKAWESHWEVHHPDFGDWDTQEALDWSDREGTQLIQLLRIAAPQCDIIDEHRDSDGLSPEASPSPDVPSWHQPGEEYGWFAPPPFEGPGPAND